MCYFGPLANKQNKASKDKLDWNFSMATPVQSLKTYLCLLGPDPTNGVSPAPKRIVQDIESIWMAMHIMYEAKEVHVPGLADRTGRRYFKNCCKKQKSWGSTHKGRQYSQAHLKQTTQMHADLKSMRAEETTFRQVN